MAQTSVVIDGKTYRIACSDGQEEHLQALGKKLDKAMRSLKEAFGDIGDQRLAVMAGILVADQLAEKENEVRLLMAEIQALKESRNALIERYYSAESALAHALNDVGKRINGLIAKLNQSRRAHKTYTDLS